MPLLLSTEKENELFIQLKKAFSDFRYFDSLISEPLKKLINDVSNNVVLDFQFTKNVLENYINTKDFETKEKKDILDKIRIILTSACVLLQSLHPSSESVMYDKEELLKNYPDFNSLIAPDSPPADKQEFEYLLKFRNLMAVALKLIPPKGNKLFLLKVIERLEGSNNEYICGSGQKPAVTRRVEIYQNEGNITAVGKRTRNDQASVTSNTSNKRVQVQQCVLNVEAPSFPTAELRSIDSLLSASNEVFKSTGDANFLLPTVGPGFQSDLNSGNALGGPLGGSVGLTSSGDFPLARQFTESDPSLFRLNTETVNILLNESDTGFLEELKSNMQK
jgi:hypothetical protein